MNIRTMRNLQGAVNRLNGLHGVHGEQVHPAYNHVGSFQLDVAYGGWKLVQVVNEQGGQSDISCGGFVSKRELWNQIQAIISYRYSQEKQTA